MTMTDPDHEYIWLQPECCAEDDTGRQWCQDGDVWDDCDNHSEPTKYVRADKLEEAEKLETKLTNIAIAANKRSEHWKNLSEDAHFKLEATELANLILVKDAERVKKLEATIREMQDD
jgi:hypothetical protein